MGIRKWIVTPLLLVTLSVSSQAYACSFEMIDSYSETICTPDGNCATWVHNIWSWLNCDGEGSAGEPYDPWPSDRTIGPPAPPPPPAPPTTDPCQQCVDRCWAGYMMCIAGEQRESWGGFCGILCREGCRIDRDGCTGNCAIDRIC